MKYDFNCVFLDLFQWLTNIYRRLFTLLITITKSLLRKMVAFSVRVSTLSPFSPFSSACLHSLYFPNPSYFLLSNLQSQSLTYLQTGLMDLWVLRQAVGRGVWLLGWQCSFPRALAQAMHRSWSETTLLHSISCPRIKQAMFYYLSTIPLFWHEPLFYCNWVIEVFCVAFCHYSELNKCSQWLTAHSLWVLDTWWFASWCLVLNICYTQKTLWRMGPL